MESTIEKAVSETRKTFKFIVQKPKVDNLKTFAQVLPDKFRYKFKANYGKILDLLNVNVQVEAISALAQYYDPPLRCFTFSDFQLAPTLEEFACIIGQPLNKGKPYHFQGGHPLVETIARALGVNPNLLDNKKQNEKTPKGIPRVRLEELMRNLVKNEYWDVLTDVLALAIYDLVLFPSGGDLVGSAAADVFMARKCRGENPTYAILADVYYTMNFCHEKKGKRILCCIPILYVWLTAHVFRRSYESYCPIVDLRRLGLKILDATEWAQVFVGLKEKSVRWYPSWLGTEEVICQCGEFPNVPLVGTLGCINYNPTLALRQLCYPMMGPPTERSIAPFMTSLGDKEMVSKICQAWGKVICKSRELGRRSCDAKEGYKQWVRDRVEQIKLPFQKLKPSIQPEAEIAPEESEELKEVKRQLAKVEAEKSAMEAKLREVHAAFEALKLEHNEKAQSLDQANKRARTEKASMDKTRVCLRSKNRELGLRNAEQNGAIRENDQLRKSRAEIRRQLNALKGQMEEQAAQNQTMRRIADQAFQEAIRGYQEHLEKKHREVEELLKGKEELLQENWQLKGEIVNLKAAHADTRQHLEDLNLQFKGRIVEYEAKIQNDRREVREVVSTELQL